MDSKFFDSLYEGDSPNGVKLGMGLTCGDFWPRVGGCSVLYRGLSMEAIDFVNLLAVAELDTSEISPPSYASHDSGSIYFYVVRRVNNCGYEAHTLTAAVRISIGANGELAEPQPSNVFMTRAEQVDGNRIWLVWYYCPIEQQSQPMCFKVYYDVGTGQIDYGNPIAEISYAGRRFYSYQSDVLDKDKYLFAVRAEDAAGVENASFAQIKIHLDTTSPGAIEILSAKAV